jgi:hypothetical protein
LREKHPDRYELAAKLIAQAEPRSGEFDKAKSMDDIGRGFLRQVGVSDENMTEAMIEAQSKHKAGLLKNRAHRCHQCPY